jgi:hypothetical protein
MSGELEKIGLVFSRKSIVVATVLVKWTTDTRGCVGYL